MNPSIILDSQPDIDVVQESYSATIDLTSSKELRIMGVVSYLEFVGFDVTHEEGTIYTVRFTGWD